MSSINLAKDAKFRKDKTDIKTSAFFSDLAREGASTRLHIGAPDALGIGAASFGSGRRRRGAELVEVSGVSAGSTTALKDIAESPTAIAGTPKSINN